MDLGCPKPVHKVEGKDSHALLYSGEYSKNKKKWKTLTSEDDAYYDKDFKVSVTAVVNVSPLPHPQAPSVNRPVAPCAPRTRSDAWV